MPGKRKYVSTEFLSTLPGREWARLQQALDASNSGDDILDILGEETSGQYVYNLQRLSPQKLAIKLKQLEGIADRWIAYMSAAHTKEEVEGLGVYEGPDLHEAKYSMLSDLRQLSATVKSVRSRIRTYGR